MPAPISMDLRPRIVGHTRVKPVAPAGMFQYIVPLTRADEVDAKMIGYIKQAFDAAG
jgi:hypothetical protein